LRAGAGRFDHSIEQIRPDNSFYRNALALSGTELLDAEGGQGTLPERGPTDGILQENQGTYWFWSSWLKDEISDKGALGSALISTGWSNSLLVRLRN